MIKKLIPNSLKSKLYKSLFKSPRQYIPSRLGNMLGLQTARSLLLNINPLRLLVPRSNDEQLNRYIKDLEINGYTVIPNFLKQEEYKKIQQEYYKLETHFNRICNERPKREKLSLMGTNDLIIPKNFPKNIKQSLVLNKDINYIIERIGKAPLNRLPSVAVYKEWYEKSDIGLPENADATQNYHADVTYPSMKAWYYIEDVNEGQGATIYGEESHRLSLKRIKRDHKMSNIRSESKELYRKVEAEEHVINDLDMSEIELNAPANSLVLFNVMGFHKRGYFKTTKSRNTIQLCYRSQKSILNHLFYFKKLKTYFTNGSQPPTPLPNID